MTRRAQSRNPNKRRTRTRVNQNPYYRMIYYVTEAGDVSIVALIHGARDLGRAWRERPGTPGEP